MTDRQPSRLTSKDCTCTTPQHIHYDLATGPSGLPVPILHAGMTRMDPDCPLHGTDVPAMKPASPE
jgi:hypothetical protein